jgi:nucleotide-binding universal stress UspA family protein
MTILCATDFSPSARAAVDAGAALARRLGDGLLVVHVVPPAPAAGAAGLPLALPGAELVLQEAAEEQLARLREELAAAGTSADTQVTFGLASLQIAELARAANARLIVLGTHGRSGPAHFILGSVAEQVVRRAPCPVLVTRDVAFVAERWRQAGPMRMTVALDSTRASDAALAWVAAFRTGQPCDVAVLRLYSPHQEAARYGVEEPWSGAEGRPDLVDLVERDLRKRIGTLPGDGSVAFRLRAVARAIEEPLVADATRFPPDLLVIGVPRGRKGDSWPSIHAGAVLRAAGVPVLCVPEAATAAAPSITRVRTVLLATDFSELSRAAIGPAYGLLLAAGGRVEILHVREGSATPADALLPPASDASEVATIEARLRGLAPPEAEALGIITQVSVAYGSDPAHAILQAAERMDVDVIVLASHGRSGLRRAVVGSVAEAVARRSSRPVLVVHTAGSGREGGNESPGTSPPQGATLAA